MEIYYIIGLNCIKKFSEHLLIFFLVTNTEISSDKIIDNIKKGVSYKHYLQEILFRPTLLKC